MTHHFTPRRLLAVSRVVTVAGCLVGSGMAAGGRAAASEVISAIPSAAEPEVSPAGFVDDGPRGTGPASRRGHAGRCCGPNCSHGRCSHGACRHAGCEIPGCPAHCPVRPATFGYYDTQWRTWPGHDIVQATYAAPVAPVMPPKSEVPRVDEESPVPDFESSPEETAAPAPGDSSPEFEPAPLPAPGEESAAAPPPSAAPETAVEPAPPEATPPGAAPPGAAPETKPGDDVKKPSDDNLFDEAALRRRTQQRLAQLGQVAAQQERLRRESLRQQAQRVVRPSAPQASVRRASHVEQ